MPTRLAAAALCLAAACAPRPAPAPSSAAEPEAARVEPPGAPLARTLETDRGHVVRLAPESHEAPPALLRVSSDLAGVMVSLDGAPPRPLPFELEVSPGLHELRATCREGEQEIRQAVAPAGATVHVRACSPPDP